MKKWIHKPPDLSTPRIFISDVDSETLDITATISGWKTGHLPTPGLYRIQKVERDDEAWIWKNTRPSFKYRPSDWQDRMCGAESPGSQPALCVLEPGHDGYHKAY